MVKKYVRVHDNLQNRFYVLVLMGSIYFDSAFLCCTEVQASEDAGITTYVIGVENAQQQALNMDHLRTIASDPVEDHMTIYEDGFDEMLSDIASKTQELVDDIQGQGTGTSTSTGISTYD